jgi:hypothetical protein
MRKRILLGLLILTAVSGFVGAQQMALSLDTMALVKGIDWTDSDKKNSLIPLAVNFEYLVSPRITVGGGADLYFGREADVKFFYMNLAAHGRYYGQSTGLDKFFVEAGLGFNMGSCNGEFDKDKGGFNGITGSLKVGYKLMFGKFFAEPSMAFVYAKSSSWQASVPTPRGWQPGLNIGMAF